MKNIYESPEDVDLTVGASVENLAPGALVGPTFQCLLNIQYSRSRIGDRFFFENGNYGNPFTLGLTSVFFSFGGFFFAPLFLFCYMTNTFVTHFFFTKGNGKSTFRLMSIVHIITDFI